MTVVDWDSEFYDILQLLDISRADRTCYQLRRRNYTKTPDLTDIVPSLDINVANRICHKESPRQRGFNIALRLNVPEGFRNIRGASFKEQRKPFGEFIRVKTNGEIKHENFPKVRSGCEKLRERAFIGFSGA